MSFISLVLKAKFKVRLSAHKAMSAKKAIQVPETERKDFKHLVLNLHFDDFLQRSAEKSKC